MERETLQQNDNGGNQPEILSMEKMEAICRRVVQYLETSKRYLSHDFCLWELGRETGIRANNISVSINSYLGRNFYDLICRLRIDEAKKLLRQIADKQSKMKIKEVGKMSGFRSRSTFYLRFAEYEGIAPAKYMSLYKQELGVES